MASISMVNDALLAVESMGPLGFFMMLVLCVSVRAMSMPTTAVELAAGCLYGVFGGTVVGAAGKTFGAAVPFTVARVVGQRYGWQVPQVIQKYLQSIHTHPVTTTMAIRVAPIPCGGSAKDTALGLLSCPSPVQFVIANVLVYTPFSFMWACLGCQAKNLVAALEQGPESPPWVKQVMMTLGPMALTGLLLGMAVNVWKMWGRVAGAELGKAHHEDGSSLVSENCPSDLRSPVSLGQTVQEEKEK